MIMAYVWSLAAGVVTAGLVASFYRLITKKPPSFQMWQETTLGLVGGIATLIFAGPSVIMRNALRAQVIENRPPVWLAASAFLSGVWSLFVGLLVLDILLA